MEKLLEKILASQERMQNDLQSIKTDINELKEDVAGLKTDVQNIKETVQRIELHQEESIMGMLRHIKKQDNVRGNQIQVLNKRLFNVEIKLE
ncbi:MAG: hypothetical protein Q8934_21890 [Bacillota bacterium]|nr:hypothetical protein [Bacillota bacterium]